ncbi:MAG: hypothetical protein GF404_07910, partial [candidate division Zixibacteria bacterium]|nr:hypothetical protein [candidate division Zixibacteria bacterium]
MDAYHKLRSDLEVSRQTHSGKTFYVIKDPVSERFFRLREPEYFLAEALDGRTSTEQVLEKFEQRFGLKITPEQLDKFIDALRQKGFLYSKSAEYQLSRASQVESKRSFIDKILYLKLKAFNPDRFLQWLYRWFKFTLSTPAVIISSLIIVVGALQVKASASLMPTNVYQIFSLSSIPLLILSIFMVVSLHELAHSIVCRHYGGKVSEMGFLLLYFQICFYCNLSDSYMFEKKSQRIKTILAGIYFQAFLGAASLLLWRIIKTGNTVSDFLFLTASVAIVTLLFNLNPLLKLDGYYLLVDIVEIPNLRSKAFNYLKQILRHVFIEPVEKLAEYTRRERNIFMVYSVLAILYSLILFFWIGSFLYNLLTDKWGGVGFLLFLSLMVVIFNEPIRNSFRSITNRSERQGVSVPKSIRFYIWMAVLAVIVALLFLFPVDLKINAPMTIEPLEKFTIKRTGT